MGAGDYALGFGPAGFDPVVVSAPRTEFRAPAAQEFDGATRDFPRDATGNFRALHPIDQGVALSLLTKRGSIKSAPEIGNTLHEISPVTASRVEQQVHVRVNDAFPLRDYLAADSVETIRIEYDISIRGRLAVAYTYRNLLLGKSSGEITVRTADG